MIEFLLDFPWKMSATLESDPYPLRVINDFFDFLAQSSFLPASFVDPEDEAEFWQRISERAGGIWIGDVIRFLNHVRHANPGNCRAIPLEGPSDIRESWQIALRDHIGDLQNWRTPQLIVPFDRMPKWNRCIEDQEARITVEDRHEQISRVIVALQSDTRDNVGQHGTDYRTHKYALADLDPWNVRNAYYPSGFGEHSSRCTLPRPEYLTTLALDHLDEEINKLRSRSWPEVRTSPGAERYWYIPPAGWSAVGLGKEQWREGTFPQQATLNPKRMHKRGPVDNGGRVWLWDDVEGHWDVQLPGGAYKRINEKGICLG